jgi:hypothetical protein
VPLGFRLQSRVPVLRAIAAHIFGLGAWPVRLDPALLAPTPSTHRPGPPAVPASP